MAGIPEGGFTKREELEAWLNGLPKSDVNSFAIVLASRASLRILQFERRFYWDPQNETINALILATFRANLIAGVACRYRTDKIRVAAVAASIATAPPFIPTTFEMASAAAAAASLLTGSISTASPSYADAAAADYANDTAAKKPSAVASFAAEAIASPAITAAVARAVEAATFARVAAGGFRAGGDAAMRDFWRVVTSDAEFLQKGGTVRQLMASPVWPNGGQNGWMSEAKRNFQSSLLEIDKNSEPNKPSHWTIWLDWYNARMEGRPAFDLPIEIAEEVETRIALGDNREDFWEREPYEINAEIAGWVKDVTPPPLENIDLIESIDIPAQNPNAPLFATNELGQIDRAPIPPEHRLLQSADQSKEYDASRKDVLALKDFGVNRLGKVASQLDELLAAMPTDMAEATIFDLWRGINRLRRTFNAHIAVGENAEGDDARLDTAVGEELGNLLDGLNNLAFGDPALRDRDQRRIPPQDRATQLEEQKLGNPIIDAILESQEIVTEAARNTLQQEDKNAKDAGESEHGAQAIEQANKTRRNVVIAFLKASLRKVKKLLIVPQIFAAGALAELGAKLITDLAGETKTYAAIGKLISENAHAFQMYAIQVLGTTELGAFIDFIVSIFH